MLVDSGRLYRRIVSF